MLNGDMVSAAKFLEVRKKRELILETRAACYNAANTFQTCTDAFSIPF
jgi:hypothetical protein